MMHRSQSGSLGQIGPKATANLSPRDGCLPKAPKDDLGTNSRAPAGRYRRMPSLGSEPRLPGHQIQKKATPAREAAGVNVERKQSARPRFQCEAAAANTQTVHGSSPVRAPGAADLPAFEQRARTIATGSISDDSARGTTPY